MQKLFQVLNILLENKARKNDKKKSPKDDAEGVGIFWPSISVEHRSVIQCPCPI